MCLAVMTRTPKITASCHQAGERRAVFNHATLVVNSGVKAIPDDVHTTSNVGALFVDVKQYLAVLVVQSLAVNIAQIVNEKVNSDVLYNTSHDSFEVKFRSSDLSCEVRIGLRRDVSLICMHDVHLQWPF